MTLSRRSLPFAAAVAACVAAGARLATHLGNALPGGDARGTLTVVAAEEIENTTLESGVQTMSVNRGNGTNRWL
jgi:hypothetical protein